MSNEYSNPEDKPQQPASPQSQQSQYPGPQHQAYGYQQQYQPQPTNGWAIAALILSILAFMGAWIPFVNFASILMGVAAVILGIVGLKKIAGKGMSIAGIIVGGISVILSIIVLLVSFAFIGAVDKTIQEMDTQRTITMSATSSGPAEVTYTTSEGTSTEAFTGTWEKDVTVTGLTLGTVSVSSENFTDTVGCSIERDGVEEDANQSTMVTMCSSSLSFETQIQ